MQVHETETGGDVSLGSGKEKRLLSIVLKQYSDCDCAAWSI